MVTHSNVVSPTPNIRVTKPKMGSRFVGSSPTLTTKIKYGSITVEVTPKTVSG